MRRNRLTEAQRRQVEKLYRAWSLQDIADSYDMSLEGVRQILLRRGVKMRPPHRTIRKPGRKSRYA